MEEKKCDFCDYGDCVFIMNKRCKHNSICIYKLQQQLQLKDKELEKSRKATQDAIDLGRKISSEKYTVAKELELKDKMIEKIENLCKEDWEDMTVDKFQVQIQQALAELEE